MLTVPARLRRQLEEKTKQQAAQITSLAARLVEVTQRQRGVLDANDELTTANVELRNMNEQLLIASEEAASSTEEIETLNEEMQATNEELETLNEELQATVEELNTTNDELEARGRDLEELGRTREASLRESEGEREKLFNALNAVDEPIVVVGANGTIAFANTGFAALSGGLIFEDGVRRTPFADVATLLSERAGREGAVAATVRVDGKELQYSTIPRVFSVGTQRFWILQLKADTVS